jgi:preprotein translocase subunit SecG
MGFLIGLLTIVMVLDCVILIALILIQLPKKEAGAGLAFGGTAADALFGAGSGTVLTKVTKYAATAFFILAVLLSILQSRYHSRTTATFGKRLTTPATPPAGAVATPPVAPSAPVSTSSVPVSSNIPGLTAPRAEATNLPPPTLTNPAVTPPPK